MANEKKPALKKPPKQYKESTQLDLFSQFVSNDKGEVSNSIEIWENIPKYFFTSAQIAKLRTATGHADPYFWKYKENDRNFTVVIQPTSILQEDGKFLAFFPGVTEELVEEVLKKILSTKSQSLHDVSEAETWVKFSLNMIYKELKLMGRERNFTEIKQAIEIMSKCNISLYEGKKQIWTGNILQDLITIDRESYITDPSAMHIGRFPAFISHAINALKYRQFNYKHLMSCNEQLTRLIYKKLINRYTHASFINDYHFIYSDLKKSGLLQQAREGNNRLKVVSALNELKQKEVITSYETEERKGGKTVVEVKYTVHPSAKFISEQKAANKRKSLAKTALIEGELIAVDKES
ncbi:MAG: hypothetical protein H0X02_00305 [Nitrosomonas sp.]|nr:hypothetical protein [Nitrosomonas sp.]